MSDIHVLEQVIDEDKVRCAFHIAVPDLNNSAVPTPMSYRTAVVEYLEATVEGGVIGSIVPGLDGTHNHGVAGESLENGFLIELDETVDYAADATPAQKATAIQNAYATRSSNLLENWKKMLKFWGSGLASS
jgi:hypothetical protein